MLRRDLKLAGAIFARSLRVLAGDRTALDSLGTVLGQEKERGIRSSWFVIPRRAHRRDASYELHHPAVRRHLARLIKAGAEIGLHGSYTSLESTGRLAAEYGKLRRAGYPVVGSRQHWLRYRTHNSLIREICAAGGWYDCSFGYRARPGFRHGACFPFPPYDFAAEAPFPVLELPLVMMDATLDDLSRAGEDAVAVAQRVLTAVRGNGWGGVSILWHDTTFGSAPVGRHIAALYWQLQATNDLWLPAAELIETVWPRYADAGLLPTRMPVPVESNA
jgi:peptidoglycan/xylan/chitin deacetylase (PgdA/CDA1 family)